MIDDHNIAIDDYHQVGRAFIHSRVFTVIRFYVCVCVCVCVCVSVRPSITEGRQKWFDPTTQVAVSQALKH